MTELQDQILDSLKSNDCNISESIADRCSLDDYLFYLKDSDFSAGVEEAKQIRHDKVLAALMKLVSIGDKTAITDYQRMQRQAGDAHDAKRIKKEFMRLCIELADTKGRCLKEYCGVFNASNKASEKAYTDVVAEYNLVTPYERSKEKQQAHSESMSAQFDAGNLSEVDMYTRMLSRALHDSEMSEYPSERSKARADVISINQRLDEIQERNRRADEQDETTLIDVLDAQLSGVHPSEIAAVRERYKAEAKGITSC